jgi:hypothetical protein
MEGPQRFAAATKDCVPQTGMPKAGWYLSRDILSKDASKRFLDETKMSSRRNMELFLEIKLKAEV